ncbi:MAG TPA: glycosyltransferase [Lichenihabitans sp.]|nr:glycosyltransferase [Lichenihabitans sp.]
MIEADDPETLAAIEGLRLPDRYDIIVGPPGWPQTKPRALNIGLHYARGDLVVVYDAEDVPDPGQLRAAAARFRARPSSVACLQARLLIDHLETNWLSLGIMAQMPQAF